MEDFKKDYGHCSAFSLSDVFWTCSTMLATRYQGTKSAVVIEWFIASPFVCSGAKFSHRRILLFTNNDNPHSASPALQVQSQASFSLGCAHVPVMIAEECSLPTHFLNSSNFPIIFTCCMHIYSKGYLWKYVGLLYWRNASVTAFYCTSCFCDSVRQRPRPR